jgi:hypothetical protein
MLFNPDRILLTLFGKSFIYISDDVLFCLAPSNKQHRCILLIYLHVVFLQSQIDWFLLCSLVPVFWLYAIPLAVAVA